MITTFLQGQKKRAMKQHHLVKIRRIASRYFRYIRSRNSKALTAAF